MGWSGERTINLTPCIVSGLVVKQGIDGGAGLSYVGYRVQGKINDRPPRGPYPVSLHLEDFLSATEKCWVLPCSSFSGGNG